MDKIYDQWFKLKGKNEDYAGALRGVLPELDVLISNHGLDKKKAEVLIKLKKDFAAALNELDRIVQTHCESQPASPLRRDKLESAQTSTHQAYSLLYNFADPDEMTIQQYNAVLDFENYLTLMNLAYSGDDLKDSDSLVSALKTLVKIEQQKALFLSLPKHGRQLAINAIKTIAIERGWPQCLYAAKSILDALNGQFSPASYIQEPWGEPVWQKIKGELKSKFPDVLNTAELPVFFIEEISNLELWEKKLADLRQRLSWDEYASKHDDWRKFVVGELSKSQSLTLEERHDDDGDSLQSEHSSEGEAIAHSSFSQAPLSGDSEPRLPPAEEVEDHNSDVNEQTGPNYTQPDSTNEALREAIEAKIEVADRPGIGVVEALYSVQALLAQRIINQFNQQLPQTMQDLHNAADNLQNTLAPQFSAIINTLSEIHRQFAQLPQVITDTRNLSKRIKDAREVFGQIETDWDDYQMAKENLTEKKLKQIDSSIKETTANYTRILQIRDQVWGLRGTTSLVSDLVQASQIEVASLYLTLGLQAARNFNLPLAQDYLNYSHKVLESVPQDDNKHIHSLWRKLDEGIEWLKRCSHDDLRILTDWRDAIYDENELASQTAWKQLQENFDQDKLSVWPITEWVEREKRSIGFLPVKEAANSSVQEEVFSHFLSLFDLTTITEDDDKGFSLYGRLVKSNMINPDDLAWFTLDNLNTQRILLNASETALEDKKKIAKQLKNDPLTDIQSEHLHNWWLWYERHMKMRQTITTATELSAKSQDVIRGALRTKLEGMIAYIKKVQSFEIDGTDLPLTRSAKKELYEQVRGINEKFPDDLIGVKNKDGVYKRELTAIQVWLGRSKGDAPFPLLSAYTHTSIANGGFNPDPSDQMQSEMPPTQKLVPGLQPKNPQQNADPSHTPPSKWGRMIYRFVPSVRRNRKNSGGKR